LTHYFRNCFIFHVKLFYRIVSYRIVFWGRRRSKAVATGGIQDAPDTVHCDWKPRFRTTPCASAWFKGTQEARAPGLPPNPSCVFSRMSTRLRLSCYTDSQCLRPPTS